MSNAIKGIVDTTETLRGNLNAEGTLSGNLNAARGFDGESAYEIALQNGFEGTEQEWLDSLQGNSGVYLGSGDMPEDCNVQIDPNGEVVTVEQLIEEITTKSATKTADGTVVSQNADFAEVAEWADGNPNNEDRTGYFVCANVPLDGIVMKKATSIDDVKGVTIFAPAFAGNYTKDKIDSNGNLLPKYSYVAIIGFVPVIDNGTCTVGGRCMPDDNGCAVPSSNSMGYQVVNRIDKNRVLIIIEPNGDMVQRVKTKINQLQDDVNNRVANALKGSASGSSVTMRDISPVEHDVPCKVGSKNLFDKNNANIIVGMFTSSGAAISPASTTRSIYIPCNPNTTYTISKMLSARFFGGFTSEIPKENVIVQNTMGGYEGITNITITSATDSKYLVVWLYHSSYDTTVTLEQILESLQIEIGTTATAYTPYVDLSTVKVQRLGKNLFDKNNANIVNGWFGGNGLINGADMAKSVYIPCLPNTTYTVSKIISARFYIGFSPTVPKAFGPIENVKSYENLSVGTSTSPSNAMYLVVWCYNSNYDTNISFEQILDSLQIEIGSMATEFEPYIEPVEFNVDANGSVQGNTYLYPTMTLMTDTEGVNISVEYNRDINKAFAALEAAIANL